MKYLIAFLIALTVEAAPPSVQVELMRIRQTMMDLAYQVDSDRSLNQTERTKILKELELLRDQLEKINLSQNASISENEKSEGNGVFCQVGVLYKNPPKPGITEHEAWHHALYDGGTEGFYCGVLIDMNEPHVKFSKERIQIVGRDALFRCRKDPNCLPFAPKNTVCYVTNHNVRDLDLLKNACRFPMEVKIGRTQAKALNEPLIGFPDE